MESRIYSGTVRHRRFTPVKNFFNYGVVMFYIDLDELHEIFGGKIFWSLNHRNLGAFHRKDYLGDSKKSLKDEVRRVVREKSGLECDGPIRMLTHVRLWGIVFNPVTFYYCFEKDGKKLKCVLAEITNTPWGERFSYVVESEDGKRGVHKIFKKEFHVSPFIGMDVDYLWSFSNPSGSLVVHMDDNDKDGKFFDATLTLKEKAWTPMRLNWILFSNPFYSLSVVFRIYAQALKLWLKKVPFHTHPAKKGVDS